MPRIAGCAPGCGSAGEAHGGGDRRSGRRRAGSAGPRVAAVPWMVRAFAPRWEVRPADRAHVPWRRVVRPQPVGAVVARRELVPVRRHRHHRRALGDVVPAHGGSAVDADVALGHPVIRRAVSPPGRPSPGEDRHRRTGFATTIKGIRGIRLSVADGSTVTSPAAEWTTREDPRWVAPAAGRRPAGHGASAGRRAGLAPVSRATSAISSSS